MLKLCEQGPEAARVTKVTVIQEGGSVAPGFKVIATDVALTAAENLGEGGAERPDPRPMSVSAPSAARLVTGTSSRPHGTMPEKCSSSGSTLRLTPCKLTQWRTRTPMLAILAPPTKMPICAVAALAFDAEAGERRDQPVLERGDEGADVAAARAEVEHHIGHALAGAVIGEAAAAAGPNTGKRPGIEQLARLGAGAGRVEGRVLEQPHALARVLRRRWPQRGRP